MKRIELWGMLKTLLVSVLVIALSQHAVGQEEGEQEEEEQRTPREAAPIDLAGYWVSIVTEDWRMRMVTPPKGNYASMRRVLNDEAVAVADSWDPEEEANACKHFGAAGLIRNPMRIRFSWDDDYTLRMETDHGMQTRIFRFAGSSQRPPSGPTMQGDSVVEWDLSGLEVVTTNMTPGFLRKNGVPYSAETVLTEYFDTWSAFGDEFLTVKSIIHDPVYLSDNFLLSTDFKKLADGSSWHPVPCGTS